MRFRVLGGFRVRVRVWVSDKEMLNQRECGHNARIYVGAVVATNQPPNV